tara:strand:+ start:980 stop:1219 length:240 start_codon:yes stop_codon:yes gene_type:complete
MENDSQTEDEENVLQLSYEIIQLIEQNISLFNDEETEEVLIANNSLEFFLDQNDLKRAIIEATNLKKYLIKLKRNKQQQ